MFGCNIDDLFSRVSLKNTGFTDADDADILQRATTIALETGRISTALLQRKLRVSYSQAVRIINEMEQREKSAKEKIRIFRFQVLKSTVFRLYHYKNI